MSGRGTVPSVSVFLVLVLLLEVLLRLVVTSESFDSDRRLTARLTPTTAVVVVAARVRVMERVTGIFRTAAHANGGCF